ncbi:hypothetical protein Ancab_001784 [Ancistrocladus abbreviatus]
MDDILALGSQKTRLIMQRNLKKQLAARFKHNKKKQDPWLEFSSVKARFSRLYLLASDHKAVISVLGAWMDNRWIWNLTWKRELREAKKRWEWDLLLLLARH